ncbi:sulfurtransferase [Salipaludibacillus neizhouensis]|uniref:Sulfurtransferase n=1 Tax=Salipaludibacillus neizhouensis TaxID=885475 RepID=A0A3A9K3X2_9BACI|nr:rhodanese-like domain-containing protein [Salipaludibacillus neizhouensis]RKL67764.1 sulfurtransferase [Salipaludibacillus neizhouensis]
MSSENKGVTQIDKDELKNILSASDSNKIVIDVREPEEYNDAHIPGVPLIPMQTIPDLLEGFDKEKEYVFVCRSGNRSQNVSLFMKQQGYEKVENYDGGMLVWDGETKQGMEKHIQNASDLKTLKNS